MNKMKKFFTLDRHHAEGFTLVELIVVIAILAILGGVAVPAYSGYIKKAHMAADQTLVSDVMKALQLQYYSNPNAGVATYVVLTPSGSVTTDTEFDAEGNPITAYVTVGNITLSDDPTIADKDASADFADKAMTAVFGADWKNTVVLAYDEWAKANFLPTKEAAEKVANSSYYKNSNPADLVSSFTGLTDSLAGMAQTAGKDPLETMKGLVMTQSEYDSMRKQLDDLDVSWDKDKAAYTTAVSNLLVQNVASEIGGYTGTDADTPSAMGELAVNYAWIYGWASNDPEGAAILADMNSKVMDPNASAQSVLDAVDEAMTKANGIDSFNTYLDGTANNDLAALIPIMGTVSDWSEKADPTIAGLFSSESITDAVNNYFAAVEIVADGNMEGFEDILMNSKGVVVYISSTGKVGCNIDLK